MFIHIPYSVKFLCSLLTVKGRYHIVAGSVSFELEQMKAEFNSLCEDEIQILGTSDLICFALGLLVYYV